MLRDEPTLTPLAGCTDLYVALNFGTLKDTRFLDLWRLDRLRKIELRGGALSIGALATFTDLIRSTLVRKRLPMLAAAAREVGGVQIQNRGTIGGNVANASPAGDTLPVLAAADAVVVLQQAEIPPVRGRQFFRKVGTRAAQAISKIVMAGILGPATGSGRTARIALGSVAPTVVRVPRTEAALASGASIEAVQRTLMEEIAPIDDLRSTAEYRRRVAANLLARFVSGASRG